MQQILIQCLPDLEAVILSCKLCQPPATLVFMTCRSLCLASRCLACPPVPPPSFDSGSVCGPLNQGLPKCILAFACMLCFVARLVQHYRICTAASPHASPQQLIIGWPNLVFFYFPICSSSSSSSSSSAVTRLMAWLCTGQGSGCAGGGESV